LALYAAQSFSVHLVEGDRAGRAVQIRVIIYLTDRDARFRECLDSETGIPCPKCSEYVTWVFACNVRALHTDEMTHECGYRGSLDWVSH